MSPSRRNFLQQSLLSGATLLLTSARPGHHAGSDESFPLRKIKPAARAIDLAPARWIWLPSQRTLPNTVLFFRKQISLQKKPLKATGWIMAESRYKLYANAQRIQFGPSPADPRWPEADPLDLTNALKAGKNWLGAEVLFYGLGEGTWPAGKPGFLFRLEVEYADGTTLLIISDQSWQVKIAQSWRPGQYKRWYLRAFQEEFDARIYPFGWNTGADGQSGWLAAEVLTGDANKPALATNSTDYLNDASADPEFCALRARSIAMLKEEIVQVNKLSENFWLHWKMPPEEYFQFVLPAKDCFERIDRPSAKATANGAYTINFSDNKAAVLTFEFREQHVGFPRFTIEAPEGTIVEMLVHEAHRPGAEALINSHFHSWTRLICREGINEFETFDYESLRWLQLHIRNARGTVKISNAGLRRRLYNWKQPSVAEVDDEKIQTVIRASVNTIYNCCQETLVDGMARERQQYSGDVGHVIHALLYGMGAPEMVSRYLISYSQGITLEGYFLDCWPAYDRLARIQQRQMDMSSWGPLLDHGVGFNFDCYYYYLHTGDVQPFQEVFPRLMLFHRYLSSIIGKNDLLPVEDIGVPAVWIDHQAYRQQKHKQCAFNLYTAAMLRYAYAPLCRMMGEQKLADMALKQSGRIKKAVIRDFWSASEKTFINNLPWLKNGEKPQMCDRSLATAVLFNQVPEGTKTMTSILLGKPDNLGISYPANACWRYWALSAQGHNIAVLDEFAGRWYNMPSVLQNNTLGEFWELKTNTNDQWSHCPVAPFYFMYMNVAGVKPLAPGCREVHIKPQPGNLKTIKLRYYTPLGSIDFDVSQQATSLEGSISIPCRDESHGRTEWETASVGNR